MTIILSSSRSIARNCEFSSYCLSSQQRQHCHKNNGDKKKLKRKRRVLLSKKANFIVEQRYQMLKQRLLKKLTLLSNNMFRCLSSSSKESKSTEPIKQSSFYKKNWNSPWQPLSGWSSTTLSAAKYRCDPLTKVRQSTRLPLFKPAFERDHCRAAQIIREHCRAAQIEWKGLLFLGKLLNPLSNENIAVRPKLNERVYFVLVNSTSRNPKIKKNIKMLETLRTESEVKKKSSSSTSLRPIEQKSCSKDGSKTPNFKRKRIEGKTSKVLSLSSFTSFGLKLERIADNKNLFSKFKWVITFVDGLHRYFAADSVVAYHLDDSQKSHLLRSIGAIRRQEYI